MDDEETESPALLHRASLVPDGRRPVPLRVMASWRRSEEYGVSLGVVDPFFVGTCDEDSLFFACGTEVLKALHATLVNEPVSLMLTDRDGLVLSRLSGDNSLLRALDAVHLAPGFSFSEREVGTNGLGLALADGVPALVRGDEHYSMSLCGYTCAAVPVIDPVTGRLEGGINLTTWSRSSSELLLALAQSAAANTSALMLARARGQTPRPMSRGEVFLVERTRSGTGAESLSSLSPAWTSVLEEAVGSLSAGQVVAAVGEAGSGRGTLLAQALRRARPRDRILSTRPPAPRDVEAWLSLWSAELGKPHTSIVVNDVDALALEAALRLREIMDHARAGSEGPRRLSLALTAQDFGDLPTRLASLVDAVVQVSALRERPEDIVPLARHAAHLARGRDVVFTPAALRALTESTWPGNVQQLFTVIRKAARRTDIVDVQHLPAELLSHPGHRLTRLEVLERDAIVCAMTRPGATAERAAHELGMSRATIYRKIRQYGLRLPGRTGPGSDRAVARLSRDGAG